MSEARATGIPLIRDIFTEAPQFSYTTFGFNGSNYNRYWRTYTDADKMCSNFIRDVKLFPQENRGLIIRGLLNCVILSNSVASSLSVRSLYLILVMSCKRTFRTIWTFKGVALISLSEPIVLCIVLLFVLRRFCHTSCIPIVCHSMAVQYGT